MKSLPLALVALASTLRAADAPLPEFNSHAIGHPPLSLRESGKFASWPRLGDATAGGLLGPNVRPTRARIEPVPPRLAPKVGPWKMPILEPNPSVDYKIVLKAPDPAIDFKMLIQPVGAEPKKEPTPGK